MSDLPAFAAILQRRNCTKQKRTTSRRDSDEYDGIPQQRPIIRNQRKSFPHKQQDSDDEIQEFRMGRHQNQNICNELEESDLDRKIARRPRRSLPSKRQPIEDDPLIDLSPVKEFTEVEYSQQEASYDETAALKSVISDLQQQIRDLEQDNRRMQQTNRSLASEVSSMKSECHSAEQMAKELEMTIDELQQVIKSKDANLAALDRDYRTLENDYKRLSDIRSAESDSLVTKQMEINRLQKELDQMRHVTMEGRVKAPEKEDTQIPRRAPVIPAAMRDNLRFGDADPGHAARVELPVEEMTDQEIQERLRVLSAEREEKERRLSRAPPKGANMAHVRRQKEELDDEIVELGKKISKLRLEMKRRDAY